MKKRARKEKNSYMSVFLLSWKKVYLVIILWIACAVLHNVISDFGFEEPIFFVLSVLVIPIFLIFSGVYSLFKMREIK